MIFIACRSGDVIQAFIGLWLVPKYVGSEELGAVLPLQQLAGLFAVPLAILATVFAKFVNTYATRGEYGKVKCFIRDVLFASVALFVLCIVVAYIIIPHFYIRLNVASGMLTFLILAAGFANNIASLFSSALQGLKKFKTMTIQNLIAAPIRLATLLIAMPFRALSGYILGQATPPASCSLLAAFSLYHDLKVIPSDTSWRKDLPEILRYLWPVAIYMAFSTLFSSVSATVYRQRLPEIESAAYYMLSRFAEIAGYIGMSMLSVLVPLASEAHENGKNGIRILLHTILATLGSAVILAFLFWLSANALISLVNDWRAYAPFSGLLPWQTLSTGVVMSTGIIVSYDMACRRFRTATIALSLNFIFTSFLVCFTGADFFQGLLPDHLIEIMKALNIASLNRMIWLTLIFVSIQLLVTIAMATLSTLRQRQAATLVKKHNPIDTTPEEHSSKTTVRLDC